MVIRGVVLLSLLALAFSPPLEAAPKKKKKAAAQKAPPPVPKADDSAVSEVMGPWRWGMTTDEVLAALQKQRLDAIAPELAKINDVYEQTRIRKQIKADVEAVGRTLLKFEGQRTGWDVSIIEDEFLHNNDESMMIYREVDPASKREQQRFFFFVGGRLWKQFIAFNMEPYKGKTFADFRGAMEARYGPGKPIIKTDREGKEKLVAVSWRVGGTNLRAIDLLQFYSNFCLAFSEASVDERMDAERQSRAPAKRPPRAIVTTPGDSPPVPDPNADVIDRITAPAGQQPQSPP